MKKLMLPLLCLLTITINAQETTKTEFDGHKWEAPYHLPTPEKWGLERFLIPISFAPQIPYKGVEDIRFTPGWANAKNEEYWSYAFLWWLDGTPETTATIIADNLKAYYTGLIEVNREGFKVPVDKITPVQTSFRETQTAKGDLKTFTGSVTMLDYMQAKPMTLNCTAHLRTCLTENKTVLFYELSPQPLLHAVWTKLNKLWEEFSCKK
jgi:hypothetical protein